MYLFNLFENKSTVSIYINKHRLLLDDIQELSNYPDIIKNFVTTILDESYENNYLFLLAIEMIFPKI